MGKTGTAEVKKHHKDAEHKDLERWNPNASHAWFAGWAPKEDPELAIVVLAEHGGSGGTVAWPIAQRILEGYFTKIKPKNANAQKALNFEPISKPHVKPPKKKPAATPAQGSAAPAQGSAAQGSGGAR